MVVALDGGSGAGIEFRQAMFFNLFLDPSFLTQVGYDRFGRDRSASGER